MRKPGVPHQLIPLAIIFAVAIAMLIAARHIFVPPSFGDYGHYRGDAVKDEVKQEIAYAGSEACLDCHDDIYNTKAASRHAGVSCEACHGPAAGHVEAPDDVKPQAPRGRDYCPFCHGYNQARPTGFPQILVVQHNPGQACMTCHQPHNPTTPHTPEECSACHRSIANSKMVSHHATLECTQCHTVPTEHKNNPRAARPTKPENRSTCATCHAQDANSPQQIPRVSISEHYPRYKCWDCHYPHHPEAT